VISWLSSPQPIGPMELHFDLLLAVRTLINTHGFTIHLVFVQSHQDTGVPMVLTWDAHMNIKVDGLAKHKADTAFAGPSIYSLPGNKWVCYMVQGQVIKQFDLNIRAHINSPLAKEYWKAKA